MAVVGVRKQAGYGENDTKPAGPQFICHPTDQTAATILISLGALGIGANVALMAVILLRRPLRRSVFLSWLCSCIHCKYVFTKEELSYEWLFLEQHTGDPRLSFHYSEFHSFDFSKLTKC